MKQNIITVNMYVVFFIKTNLKMYSFSALENLFFLYLK